MSIVLAVILIIAALAIGVFSGFFYHKNTVEAKIGRTEEYVRKLVDDSQRKANEEAKEMKLKAKEEVLQQKS